MKKDVIIEKKKVLNKLQKDSGRALNVVNSTIEGLALINSKIDNTLEEIQEAKDQLQSTANDLLATKNHNGKVIDNFKKLIEV
jgi:hypothetical protein